MKNSKNSQLEKLKNHKVDETLVINHDNDSGGVGGLAPFVQEADQGHKVDLKEKTLSRMMVEKHQWTKIDSQLKSKNINKQVRPEPSLPTKPSITSVGYNFGPRKTTLRKNQGKTDLLGKSMLGHIIGQDNQGGCQDTNEQAPAKTASSDDPQGGPSERPKTVPRPSKIGCCSKIDGNGNTENNVLDESFYGTKTQWGPPTDYRLEAAKQDLQGSSVQTGRVVYGSGNSQKRKTSMGGDTGHGSLFLQCSPPPFDTEMDPGQDWSERGLSVPCPSIWSSH